jgi:hypothetical protein
MLVLLINVKLIYENGLADYCMNYYRSIAG